MLKNRLKRELSIFNQLRPDVRKLVLSIFCQIIANSLIFVFANAYLFVSTNNISAVAVFNLGLFLMILVGFYLNAFLAKFIEVRHIFVPALVLQGASLAILFLFETLSLGSIFGVGLVVGLAVGLYWSNRNFIYPTLTQDRERDYIAGITTLVGNISGVVLPLVAGWLIVWARTKPSFGADGAYMVIVGFGVLILFMGAFFLNQIQKFPTLKVTHFWPQKISLDWKLFRSFVLFSTVQMAVGSTVVEAITLSFLGDEGALGLIKSVLAIVAGTVIYVLGRKMQPKDRFKLLLTSALFLVVGVLLVLVNFSQFSLMFYIVAITLAANIFWFVYIPIMSKAVEMQDEGLIEDNYVYVLDHEVFINLGRVVSMLFILFVFHYLDDKSGIIVVIAAGAVAQALGMMAARKLIRLQSLG